MNSNSDGILMTLKEESTSIITNTKKEADTETTSLVLVGIIKRLNISQWLNVFMFGCLEITGENAIIHPVYERANGLRGTIDDLSAGVS